MGRQKNDGRGRNNGGRRKGTPNKATAKIKDWVVNVVYKNRRQIEQDLQALDPKDRIQVLEKLMQYVIPKQQSVSADIDVNSLSDSQLDILIEELTAGIEIPATDDLNDK